MVKKSMSFSFNFNLKSHKYESWDKLLYEHLKNVGEISKEIVSNKIFKNKEIYEDAAYLIGISHDFAKATTYFQKHLEEGIKTEKAYHGKLSSIFGYYLLKNWLGSRNSKLPIISWLVIMKHHGDIVDLMGIRGELEKLNDVDVEIEQIKNLKKNNLVELSAIYKGLSPIDIDLEVFFNDFESICEEIKERGEEMVMEKKIENYFLILFFYSVLLDADKLDASEIGLKNIELERKRWNSIPPDVVDDYKEAKFCGESEIGAIRNESYNEVISNIHKIDLENERIFSIELPTGCGKTLTALSSAFKLRDRVKNRLGFTPRIIYSLPFLSIIDQNADVFSEVLIEYAGIANWKEIFEMEGGEKKGKLQEIPTSLFLKHHHLADVRYKTKEALEIDAGKSLLLMEGWHSEIVITTFVQFFHSLITNRNRAARKFHNIVNSVILLDEVQSIPYQYWVLVNEALKHLAYDYNCWIILITATQPLIFKDNEIKPLIEDKREYFQRFNRLKYLIELNEKNIEEFKGEVLGEILDEEKDVAIVVNTIGASKDLYKSLRKELKSVYGEPRIGNEGMTEFKNLLLVNLSTHIFPIHRSERIRRIKDEGKRKIVVTTQLIEAGVDIDMDIIYRDFAPFDSIVQSGGRCNRNNSKKEGVCKILSLKSGNNKKFSRIYDSTLLGITKEIFGRDRQFEEKNIDRLIHIYFEKIKERGTDEPSKKNIAAIRKLNFSKIGEFRLIKESQPKVDVFVEIDGRAIEIWKEYKEIRAIENRLKRREEFLKIRNRFYEYIISVDEGEAKRIPEVCECHYISSSQLNEHYDLETGFNATGDALIW